MDFKKIITNTSIYSFQIKCCGGPFGEINWESRMTQQLALLLFHSCFLLVFSIFMFWTIGRYSIASRNCLLKCRVLQSSPFLSSSFRALNALTKGRVHPFRYSPSVLGNVEALVSSFFLDFLFPFVLKFSCLHSNFKYLKLKSFHQILKLN